MILLFSGRPTFHPVSVVSPLNVSQFTLDLAEHPNWQAVNYALEGLEHSFRLGFQPARRLRAAKRNKPSAFQNPHIIDKYLANEVARSRVAGPFTSIPLPNLNVSMVVLGIELDSIDQSAHLPAEKLANLHELIQSWQSRRWCTRRQLESLIRHFTMRPR